MIEWQNHKGNVLTSVSDIDVIDCKECGFKHIVPIPTPEELDRYYKEKFYGAVKPDYFKKHLEDLDWWNLVYKERYEEFEKHTGKPGKILDIGSGTGFFLKLGNKRGWEVKGVEPSEQATEYARKQGIDVLNGMLNRDHIKQLGKFDIVHSGWVLEHLRDPVDFCRICYELLKPNGMLCLVVANDFNPLQDILQSQMNFKPWWIVPQEHINYFSISSLKNLLQRCGFEFVHVTTSFPLEFFLLMGDNYVGNDTLGRTCHIKRKNLEFALYKSASPTLKKRIYDAFAANDIGRDITIYVKKSI